MPPIRVYLVEDDPRPRASLRALLESIPEFLCCGDAGSSETALRDAPAAQPEIVLMDIGLPGMDGIDCARQLKPVLPQAQIVMLTGRDDPSLVFRALAAGASGYLMKYEAPDRILAALLEVHRGGGMMSPAVARLVMARFQPPTPALTSAAAASNPLSPRETEILELMRDAGLSTGKELAERLGISPRTVETHLRGIYDKLHVHTRTAALAKFMGR
jgi:DNA-binding NarL/FixJ family response regulator